MIEPLPVADLDPTAALEYNTCIGLLRWRHLHEDLDRVLMHIGTTGGPAVTRMQLGALLDLHNWAAAWVDVAGEPWDCRVWSNVDVMQVHVYSVQCEHSPDHPDQ